MVTWTKKIHSDIRTANTSSARDQLFFFLRVWNNYYLWSNIAVVIENTGTEDIPLVPHNEDY